MVVVEIDGGYHDVTSEEDLRREKHIRQLGWDIVRFTDKDVEEDAEAVARAIAQRLRLPYEFQKRNATGAGMNSVNAAKKNSA